MPWFDLPRDALEAYDPRPTAPHDLADFWRRTLDETRAHPLDPTRVRADSPLTAVETYDVSWRGFGGDVVHGWLHLPAAALRDGRPPRTIVQYQGYGGGRGLVFEDAFWATAGYAHLIMDTRGQGSGWSTGDTPDPHGSAPSQPGFLTRGLLDRDAYYYRRVYADVVRALEFMRAQDDIDSSAIAVTGGSQGGGLSIAAAALDGGVAAAMIDVPFLCDFRRASEIALTDPYRELSRYLALHRDHEERAFATLSYFDGAVLAQQASAPALFSVALMDETCPPSTVYAAYNGYAGPKQIAVYPYNDHEGGEVFHRRLQVQWLARTLPRG